MFNERVDAKRERSSSPSVAPRRLSRSEKRDAANWKADARFPPVAGVPTVLPSFSQVERSQAFALDNFQKRSRLLSATTTARFRARASARTRFPLPLVASYSLNVG